MDLLIPKELKSLCKTSFKDNKKATFEVEGFSADIVFSFGAIKAKDILLFRICDTTLTFVVVSLLSRTSLFLQNDSGLLKFSILISQSLSVIFESACSEIVLPVCFFIP